MNTGSMVSVCLAVLFFCLVVPWSMAVAYRRRRTSNAPRTPKKVVENANSYRRYRQYTVLILCWAVAIAAYVIVLDRAVNDNDFVGARGSKWRNINFEVLSFIRTGFAVIHLPLMTTVLAATIPYWTMAKSDRSVPETAPLQPTTVSDNLDRSTTVTQLFYLADKSWAGFIGWITTAIYGWKEGALSYTWAQLAIVAALSYAGFPLLSLAYVTTSTQYWEERSMPATVSFGGLSPSYSGALESMRDTQKWMRSEDILNTTLNTNLSAFKSSKYERG